MGRRRAQARRGNGRRSTASESSRPASRSRRFTVRSPCSASRTSTRPPPVRSRNSPRVVTARTICSEAVVFPPVWRRGSAVARALRWGRAIPRRWKGRGARTTRRVVSGSSSRSCVSRASRTSATNSSAAPLQSHRSLTGDRTRTVRPPMIRPVLSAPVSPGSSASWQRKTVAPRGIWRAHACRNVFAPSGNTSTAATSPTRSYSHAASVLLRQGTSRATRGCR
jgi:hypothetical protein